MTVYVNAKIRDITRPWSETVASAAIETDCFTTAPPIADLILKGVFQKMNAMSKTDIRLHYC